MGEEDAHFCVNIINASPRRPTDIQPVILCILDFFDMIVLFIVFTKSKQNNKLFFSYFTFYFIRDSFHIK